MGRIFVSYSHKDKKWLKDLQTFLKPHLRGGDIESWDDTQIRTGQKWKEIIDQELERATVALFLVTPNFLASQFINDVELPALLKSADERGVHIVWIAVRHGAYKKATDGKDKSRNLTDYQCANDPKRPLASLRVNERDQVWTEICETIVNLFGNPTQPRQP